MEVRWEVTQCEAEAVQAVPEEVEEVQVVLMEVKDLNQLLGVKLPTHGNKLLKDNKLGVELLAVVMEEDGIKDPLKTTPGIKVVDVVHNRYEL